MKKIQIIGLFLPMVLVLGGCALTNNDDSSLTDKTDALTLPKEELASPVASGANKSGLDGAESPRFESVATDVSFGGSKKMREMQSLRWDAQQSRAVVSPRDFFSNDKKVSVSAEKMLLSNFIHYTFGELLGVNYILGPRVSSEEPVDEERVTLSVTQKLGEQDLFDLVSQLLIQRNVNIKYLDANFFISKNEGSPSKASVSIGLGREFSALPKNASRIMQVVPLKFGVKVSIERLLRELTSAKISPDYSQSVIFVEGSREEVIQAIELIDLLDTPAMRGRYIGMIELDFISPEAFSSNLGKLLKNEGIDLGVGEPNNKNLVIVPLGQLGSVVVFATNEFLLERVNYWASIIDVQTDGPGKQYFIYNPKFSRALDIDDSISSLLGLKRDQGGSAQSDGSSTGNAPSRARASSGGDNDLNMVVDERANALIFYSTGDEYRALLPLLRKLDVMPKQVMLDLTIAEVSLKDEFKHGVEWAIARGEVNLTTQGAFGATNVGGMGLLINGTEGPLQANFLSTNNLVNIISNPSLMVRDGVTATINVGSDVSVVGQTTQDPINGDRQTTRAEYRKTGISVQVKPTVNANGIVILAISQTISNSVPGSSGAGGNPDIFERSLNTEVVAQSGQTVLLAGLISENSTTGGSGTPGLSKIPLLGNLFKSKSNSSDRTELAMLVTARVVEDAAAWDDILNEFKKGLLNLAVE